MKTITSQNKKTLNSLKNKVNGNGRMPSLKKVSELLNELGIENNLESWTERRWSKPQGYRYSTSGGTKEYTGFRLRVSKISLDINSTETYYTYNTWQYAQKLLELITNKGV